MKSAVKVLAGVALFAMLLAAPLWGAERKDVPEKYTWNVTDVYPSKAAWEEAKANLAKRTGDMDPFKGHLADSPQTLLKALQTQEAIDKELSRVALYAGMSCDVDTRVSESQAMRQSVEKLASDLEASFSFMEPEILSMDPKKFEEFMASEKGLMAYKPSLNDILRQKPHILDAEGEKILARTDLVMGSPGAIYTIFTNADMPFPEVTLSTGEKVRLDQSGYSKYRASSVREDREKVFRAFWETYAAYRRTLGTTLYSHVKAHMVNKDVRNYDSCLAAALDGFNIPTAVYRQLIADVHANLPTLHRYLKLRQRMMGVDKLRYDDLYAPLVKNVEMQFSPEEAMDIALKATTPLGPFYTSTLKKGYESRWVDFLPTTGKKSGAYSTGAAYDVHPFQLLNFNGRYGDVSTLVHESGHSMHSYFSNKNQIYANAHYSIFVAEVASTLNENLLFHYMLDNAKDDETRLFILGEFLDRIRQTLFRQTLFADFELRIHEMAEHGESLTGDSLTKLYLQLLRQYYGHDAGVCNVDELYGNEWAFIPHFYRGFYVYQYATSMVASTAIANKIREDAALKKPTTKSRDLYLQMLSAGSSKYPVDLLKDAGVDMTTSAPFNAAIKEMNSVIDRIEAILNKKVSK